MMQIERESLIDWELATRLAGNKRDLAEELLTLFINSLPRDIALIQQQAADKNYIELAKQLHRLHGAISYCGLPRLKATIATLEKELTNKVMTNLPDLLDQLNQEVALLLQTYPSLDKPGSQDA